MKKTKAELLIDIERLKDINEELVDRIKLFEEEQESLQKQEVWQNKINELENKTQRLKQIVNKRNEDLVKHKEKCRNYSNASANSRMLASNYKKMYESYSNNARLYSVTFSFEATNPEGDKLLSPQFYIDLYAESAIHINTLLNIYVIKKYFQHSESKYYNWKFVKVAYVNFGVVCE